MGAMDACNARFGRGSVVPARAGLAQQRRARTTKFEMCTPRYTTQVDELPGASADAPRLSPPLRAACQYIGVPPVTGTSAPDM